MIVKNKIRRTYALIFVVFMLGFGQFNHSTFVSAITKTPSARYGLDMIYDSKNNQTVLFGGDNSETINDNLIHAWIYSSTSQSWAEISDSTSPNARVNHQMVFNSITGKVILFGGMETSGYTKLDDTWEFDPDTNEWTELQPTVSPSARTSHAMYFDPVFNVVVLFGGYYQNDQLSSETWIYNCTINSWTQIYPATSPTTRYGHTFVYDIEESIGVFFGGNSGGQKDETWFFNLSSITWIQKTPTPKPLRRYWFDMVYNPFDKKFIMFGGDNEGSPSSAIDDTWTFSSSEVLWTKIEPSISPPPRNNHAMVFDTYLNKTLLFGGYGEDYTLIYGDFWMFDSTVMEWTQISSAKNNIWKYILIFGVAPIGIIGIAIVGVILVKKQKTRKKSIIN